MTQDTRKSLPENSGNERRYEIVMSHEAQRSPASVRWRREESERCA